MIGIDDMIRHLKLKVSKKIIGIFRPFEKLILSYYRPTEKTFDPRLNIENVPDNSFKPSKRFYFDGNITSFSGS